MSNEKKNLETTQNAWPTSGNTTMRWPDVPEEQAPEIKFNRNYGPRVWSSPVIAGLSQTVPDQHMTIREILDRHMRGLPMKGTVREPLYTGTLIRQIDDELTHLSDMREELEMQKAQLEKEQAAKDDKKAKEAQVQALNTQGPAEGGKPSNSGLKAADGSGATPPEVA